MTEVFDVVGVGAKTPSDQGLPVRRHPEIVPDRLQLQEPVALAARGIDDLPGSIWARCRRSDPW